MAFYEKVIKVKADVAAFLYLISVFFCAWYVSSIVAPFLSFYFSCSFWATDPLQQRQWLALPLDIQRN
jgi:hypothetical protein